MEQEEAGTLEARRQLIWDAQREGYQMAIEDLEAWGSGLEVRWAIQLLRSKLKEQGQRNKEAWSVP